MATDFTKPVNTTPYATVWDFVRDNIDLVSTWFDEAEIAGVNIQTNAKRYSSTNKRFEYWSGSAWLELLSKATTAYDIRVAVADLADLATTATTAATCTGNSATASLATNSLQLGGIVASSYTKNTDIRSVTYGGTGSNTTSGARTNLSVYSKTESDDRYLNESNNLSDLDSASTARTNLNVYSKTETYTKAEVDAKPLGATGSGVSVSGTNTVTLGYQPSSASVTLYPPVGEDNPSFPSITITSTGFTFIGNLGDYSWVAFA